MITGTICLLVGLGIGYFHGYIHGVRGRACSPRAVSRAFNEWRTTGEVSAETMAWLETGVKPR